MERRKILVVDDDSGVRFAIRTFLEAKDLEVIEADGVESGYEEFASGNPDAVVLDYRLPDGSALDLLPRLQDLDPSVPVVILTAHGSIDLAVRAIKEGADHFLTKPVEMATLLLILQRLLKNSRSRRLQIAQRPAGATDPLDPFSGKSPAILDLYKQATRFLQTTSPVLILGETGVGKGVLARWIHDHGPRSDEAFVHINCAGLTPVFLDTELFGHAKGAFTGAGEAKPGLLEIANRGTIFLDEVADVDPEIQPKLLKVLEDKTFRRLGEVRDRTVNVRLIAATNRSLTEAVEDGSFRSDLYYRISALPLRFPALREREEDIPRLVWDLMRRISVDLARPAVRLSEQAVQALRTYSWPGNIRELRNVLERAVLLTEADLLTPSDLCFGEVEQPDSSISDTRLTLEQIERRHISAVLAEEDGHVERTAMRLGLPRSTLYKKLKRLQLQPTGLPGDDGGF